MAKLSRTIEDILDDVLSEFGKLPGFIGTLGEIANRLVSSVSPLVAAIQALKILSPPSGVTTAPQTTTPLTGQIAAPSPLPLLGRILNALERILNEIRKGPVPPPLPQGTVISPVNTGGAAGSGGAGGIGGAGGAGGIGGASGFAKIAAVGAVVATSLAVVAISLNVIEREFRKLESLVRLFNPSVVTVFQQAMDNLGATMGRSFVPLFQDATQVIRQWTATLAPVIQSFTPIVKQFSDIFSNILVGTLTQLGNVFRSMLPTVKLFGEVMVLVAQASAFVFNSFALLLRGLVNFGRLLFELSGLGIVVRLLSKAMEALNVVFTILDEAMTIFETVLNTVVDAVGALIGSVFPLQGIMDQLTRAVQTVIRNLYVMAIMLAKLAGFDAVVDAILKSLEDRATAKGDVAAQTPQIKTLEQLSKDLSLAAATAGGAAGQGGVKNQQEFWNRVLKDAKDAAANGISIKDILVEIRNAILKLVPGAGGPPAPPPGPAQPGVGGINIPRIVGGIIGGPLGGVIGDLAGRAVR